MGDPVSELDAVSLRPDIYDHMVAGTVGIAMRDSMAQETVASLLSTKWPDNVDKLIFRGSILTLQRNAIIAAMRGDWVLFIDDDMTWQPDALIRLIARLHELRVEGFEVDILGALCCRRVYPYQPTMYAQPEPGKGSYTFIERWDDEVVEVDATGMAFAIVTRQCLERLGGPMPPYEERKNERRHPDFFKWQGALGEDLRFCQEVRRAGGRVFVDTTVEIGHVATHVVGYRDYLKAMIERPIEEVQRRIAMELETGTKALRPIEAKELLRGLEGR